jgi:hypothetical protein
MRHDIYTDREAADILVEEGHAVGHVRAEMRELVRAGLLLDQPPSESLLTEDEVDLLRMRLCEQGE